MYEYSDLEKIWKNLFDDTKNEATPESFSHLLHENKDIFDTNTNPHIYSIDEENSHKNYSNHHPYNDHHLKSEIEFLKKEFNKMQKKHQDTVTLLYQKDKDLMHIDQYLSQIEKLLESIE